MKKEKYDSTQDTLAHIARVRFWLNKITVALSYRGHIHDNSKLQNPEKKIFDKMTPKLKGMTYGSEEYKQSLAEMKPALDHHYAANSHHPEHYENGINDMTLTDIVEMFCDWKAATERHADGCLAKSIEHNKDRFEISEQLTQIFRNTQKKLDW